MLDASQPLTDEDQEHLDASADKKRVLIANKSDLPTATDLPGAINTCCLDGMGIEDLKDAIRTAVWSGDIRADMLPVMINARHQDALRRAWEAVEKSLSILRADETLELAAMDLRIAANATGEVVGKTSTEDLLDTIFSQFCIGK